MSRSSSSSSSTWTRGSDANWTMPQSKGGAVLQSPAKIVLSTLQVKVMTTEPGCSLMPNAGDAALKKRQRLRQWLKASIAGCIKALTLRCCLRPHQKRSAYTETCRGPALDSKPTISTNQRGNSSSIEFVAIQSPVHEQAPADADNNLNVRSTRLTAREMERCGAKLMPKKSGIWSTDEHERYCAALERYRYGSWKQIADHVGSRTERQVLSHAQSIRARRKKEDARKQTFKLTPSSGTKQQVVSPHLPLPNTRVLTPEELLVASMTDPVPTKSPPVVSQADPDTTFPELPPWDLSLDLDVSFSEEFDALTPLNIKPKHGNGETADDDGGDDSRRSCKRSKPNSDTSITFDAPLMSSPLEILLEGVLTDEDLLELLDIPSTRSEVTS